MEQQASRLVPSVALVIALRKLFELIWVGPARRPCLQR